jgi:hypothetical protein
MDDADRFRLLGTYRTPRFRIDQRTEKAPATERETQPSLPG